MDEERLAAVLFCDLSASSTMYNTLSSAEIVDVINEYLERQADIILRYGGAIDKYLGDGAMFVFNPRRSGGELDHVARAVDAAVDMQRDFEILKRSWAELGMPLGALFNRIGMAAGPLLSPIMGHPQFQQVTVFGDTVARANHLCETAPRNRNIIIVDEDVRSHTGQRISMSPMTALGDLRPGKPVYEVVTTSEGS
jgi:adenylate cyclase